MTEVQFAFFVGIAVSLFLVWFVSPSRLARKKDQCVMLHPMEANVMVQCKTCRGHGRRGIAVDPREFTRHEDKKLKPEDFPICEECEGRGSVFFLSVKLEPIMRTSFVGGTLLPATPDSHGQHYGASALPEDFQSGKSTEDPVLAGTSSTPLSPTSTSSSASKTSE